MCVCEGTDRLVIHGEQGNREANPFLQHGASHVFVPNRINPTPLVVVRGSEYQGDYCSTTVVVVRDSGQELGVG